MQTNCKSLTGCSKYSRTAVISLININSFCIGKHWSHFWLLSLSETAGSCSNFVALLVVEAVVVVVLLVIESSFSLLLLLSSFSSSFLGFRFDLEVSTRSAWFSGLLRTDLMAQKKGHKISHNPEYYMEIIEAVHDRSDVLFRTSVRSGNWHLYNYDTLQR